MRYVSDFGLFNEQNCIPSPSTSLAYPLFNHTADIRANLPKYNIYGGGKLIAIVDDVSEYWRDESLTFLFKCSYPFNPALAQVGIPPRRHVASTAIPMYQTTLPLNSTGAFAPGTTIVSMCPYRLSDVPRIREIIATYRVGFQEAPNAWGWNSSQMLGTEDINFPGWGETVEFEEDELPAFWDGAVAAQDFLTGAQDIDGFAITHNSGGMLIYDLCED